MKIAIIGAGLSGLSCAFELQKYGIVPDIFEKTTIIGENLEIPVILLRMFNTPMRNPLKYLERHYGLALTPHYDINELITYTPNKTTVINRHIGWIFRRGSFEGSMPMQIRKLVNAPITMETPIDFKDIKNSYDHIVIATGSMSEAEEMNMMEFSVNAIVRVATIEGKFRTDSVKIWMDTAVTKNSYAYLIPDTETRAKLVLIVNDIQQKEMDTYWEKLLNIVKLEYKIIRTLDITHKLGPCRTVQLGNLYFTGNAGGFIDDFLGIGSPFAVISGIFAARAIVESKNYTKMMSAFTNDIKKKHNLRNALNFAENEQLDRMNRIMGSQASQLLVYGNPLFRITRITPLIGLYAKFKQKAQQYRNKK